MDVSGSWPSPVMDRDGWDAFGAVFDGRGQIALLSEFFWTRD